MSNKLFYKIKPVLFRLLTYGIGFAQIAVFARIFGEGTFGKFSVLQSVLEVSFILAVFGLPIMVPRLIKQYSIKFAVDFSARLLLFGLPLSILLFSFYLHGRNIKFYPDIILLVVTLVLQSAIAVILAFFRSTGKYFFVNTEGSIKALVMLILVLICSNFYEINIDLTLALLLQFFAMITMFGILFWGWRFGYPNKMPENADKKVNLETFEALLTNMLQFIQKKSDLILVSLFESIKYVASFKVAFLIAEVPLQLIVSIFVNKTSVLLEENYSHQIWAVRIMRYGVISGALAGFYACTVGPVIYYMSETVFGFSVNAETIAILLIYFIWKCFAYPLESIMLLRIPLKFSRAKSSLEALAKVAAFLIGGFLLNLGVTYIYFFILIVEILLFFYYINISVKQLGELNA